MIRGITPIAALIGQPLILNAMPYFYDHRGIGGPSAEERAMTLARINLRPEPGPPAAVRRRLSSRGLADSDRSDRDQRVRPGPARRSQPTAAGVVPSGRLLLGPSAGMHGLAERRVSARCT